MTLNTPWFFDSDSCYHMTFDPSLLSSKTFNPSTPTIHTADGSHMHVSQVGHVSTSHLTLPNTYLVPKLILNLITEGQLCELGLDLQLSFNGCQV